MRRCATLLTLLAVVTAGCAKMRLPRDSCCGPFDPTVTHDEIEAAAHLQYESSRTETLGGIASRRLYADEQQHLVCAAVQYLTYESSRQIVLQQLIDNPAFTPDAKACILHRLDTFETDAARIRILKALEGHGDKTPDLMPDVPPARIASPQPAPDPARPAQSVREQPPLSQPASAPAQVMPIEGNPAQAPPATQPGPP